jgi:hypothetical protein
MSGRNRSPLVFSSDYAVAMTPIIAFLGRLPRMGEHSREAQPGEFALYTPLQVGAAGLGYLAVVQ